MGVRIRAAVIIAALATYSFPNGSEAQSVTPNELEGAARQGEQLLREQQQMLDEQKRARDRETQLPSGAQLNTPPAPSNTTPSTEGQCLQVRSLELVGARHLSKKLIAHLDHDVTGKCVGINELNDLLRRITSAYVSRGYTTSRAYIPPQDSQSGKLTIVVVEGTVERIDVQPKGDASAATAFPGMVGNVFNLRNAEQGIDQLNRLSSNDAKLEIQPGSTPGSSVIVVSDTPGRRLSGSLAVDNGGSPQTGDWQATATLIADDPLGLNDGFLISHTRSDPSGPADSRSTAVNYSIPYGWWMGAATFTDSDYASLVQGPTRSFVASGTDRDATLRLDRVAYRDQSRKLTVYADLIRRDMNNYVAGELIQASSRVLTVFDVDANLSLTHAGALWSFDAGAARGLPWLGALHDPGNLPAGAPSAQYTKLTGGAAVSKGFEPFGIHTQLASTMSAQWSNDTLYSSEQIGISGPYAVRGFRDVRLFADRGLTWRNELSFPFALHLANTLPLSIRPFLGADYGRMWSHDAVRGGYVTGWTAGASAAIWRLNLQLSWSSAAWRSSNVPDDHMFFARFSVGI
jgi:hemolysin activation/secretion protein